MELITLIGGVTAEPKEGTDKNGVKYLSVNLAVTRFLGGNQESVYYTVFTRNPEHFKIIGTLKKGSQICVSGSYSDSSYCQGEKSTINRNVTLGSIQYVQRGGNGQQQGQGGGFQKKNYNQQSGPNTYQQAPQQQPYQQSYQNVAPQQGYVQQPQMQQPAQMVQQPYADDLPF